MPRLLDLFCGAGGAAMGYHRAGFTEIVGVDTKAMPRYPFEFVQADALEYVADHGREFDVIHASPPCQAYSVTFHCRPELKETRLDLLPATRKALEESGKPWVIENTKGAPMRFWSANLCGLMFGLKVFRHRLFESSILLLAPPHEPHGSKRIGVDGMVCVAGSGGAGTNKRMGARCKLRGGVYNVQSASAAMGIDWMTKKELAQAIPPAYTEFIGKQLLEQLCPTATR